MYGIGIFTLPSKSTIHVGKYTIHGSYGCQKNAHVSSIFCWFSGTSTETDSHTTGSSSLISRRAACGEVFFRRSVEDVFFFGALRHNAGRKTNRTQLKTPRLFTWIYPPSRNWNTRRNHRFQSDAFIKEFNTSHIFPSSSPKHNVRNHREKKKQRITRLSSSSNKNTSHLDSRFNKLGAFLR